VPAWIKIHQKQLSLAAGVLMLLLASAMLFWDNRGDTVTEESLAAANVARMEARMQAQSSGAKASPETSIFSGNYREKQQQQLRYAVIALMITGVGFLLYGFLKKEEG